jgi:hypothetical protein
MDFPLDAASAPRIANVDAKPVITVVDSFGVQVASSVDEAVRWLTEQTGQSYPSTLPGDVRALEQQIQQRTAVPPDR